MSDRPTYVSFSLDTPYLKKLGWSRLQQETFRPRSFVYAVDVLQDSDVLGVDDFAVETTGSVSAKVTSVKPIEVPEYYSTQRYEVRIDDVSGDGTLQLGFTGEARFNTSRPNPLTIDSSAPQIRQIRLATPTGSYGPGATVSFDVQFDERIGVTGSPSLELSNGAQAVYAGGSGTSTLRFNYTAGARGEDTTNLKVIAYNDNGAVTQDVAGNDVEWGAEAFPLETNLSIRGGLDDVPAITELSISHSGPGALVHDGHTITYALHPNRPVDVAINPGDRGPTLTLSNGTLADYVGQGASGDLLFKHVVTASDPRGALAVTGINLGNSRIKTGYDVGFGANIVVPMGFKPNAVAVEDVNKDGIADIIAAGSLKLNGSNSVSVLLGNKNGTYTPSASLDLVDGRGPATLLIADINQDGRADIVTATTNYIDVATGDGTGGFSQFTRSSVLPPRGSSENFMLSISKIGTADFRGNGVQQLFVNGNQVLQYAGTDGSKFADFYKYSVVNVYTADASGHLTLDETLSSGPAAGGRSSSFVDVDGDGRLDLVGPSVSGDFMVGYEKPKEYVYNDVLTGEKTNVEVGGSGEKPTWISLSYGLDLNSTINGSVDGHSPWQNGDGAYFQGYDARAIMNVSTAAILTPNGKPAAISAGENSLSVIEFGADGTYSSCLYKTQIYDPFSVKTADVDGDGHLDIIVFGNAEGENQSITQKVEVFLNFGDGRLLPPSSELAAGLGNWRTFNRNTVDSLAMADMNGDGLSDIVMAKGDGVEIRLNESTPSEFLDLTNLGAVLARQQPLLVSAAPQPPHTSEPPSSVSTTDMAAAANAAGQAVQSLSAGLDKAAVVQAISTFLTGLSPGTSVNVSTFTPTAGTGPISLTGPTDGTQSLVNLDASALPPGTPITLNNVGFVVLSGPASLIGGDGSQVVFGDTAAQSMVLGADDDTLHGGGGNDVVGSKAGNDLLYGDAGNDTVFGGTGNDTLFGGTDQDLVYGNQDADLIYGNQGADSLYGGQGDDRAFGGQGDDRIWGNLGNDVMFGNIGADLVYGNQGNDIVYGNQGADILYGGQGNDVLYGGQGDDALVGGIGDDTLAGGLGADLYRFERNSGRDLILGFSRQDGDRIALGGQTYTLSSAQNGDARLTLSGGGVVDLAGIRVDQVNAAFFVA